MREEYVSPDAAKLLMGAGFNEPTRSIYTSDNHLHHSLCEDEDTLLFVYRHEEIHSIRADYELLEIIPKGSLLAPALHIAQRWLREQRRIFVSAEVIYATKVDYTYTAYAYHVNEQGLYWRNLLDRRPVGFSSFEEALRAAVLTGLRDLESRELTQQYLNAL